jgi:hypothetical protein
MSVLDSIVLNAETDYIAENGLMRLNPKNSEPQEWPKHDLLGLETVANDNGILFLAYYYALLYYGQNKRHIAKRTEIATTIERLVRLPYRGIFNREPSADKTPSKLEQHDNYVGIIFLSTILGLSYQSEIISHGVMNSWNYNNIDPKKFDIRTQRQPGEVAFYQLCHSGRPELIGFIAMIFGIIVNAFKKNAGENNLTWLRLYCLELNADKQSYVVRGIISCAWFVWYVMMIFKWDDFTSSFFNYFGPHHPISRVARVVRL